MTDPEGVLVADIFQQALPLTITDSAGASPIHVVASPGHGMLMLCQDSNGDYDVIVMSQLQAQRLADALDDWVGSLRR